MVWGNPSINPYWIVMIDQKGNQVNIPELWDIERSLVLLG